MIIERNMSGQQVRRNESTYLYHPPLRNPPQSNRTQSAVFLSVSKKNKKVVIKY